MATIRQLWDASDKTKLRIASTEWTGGYTDILAVTDHALGIESGGRANLYDADCDEWHHYLEKRTEPSVGLIIQSHKHYRQRDGGKAVVLGCNLDAPLNHQYVGWDSDNHVCAWTPDGRVYETDENSADLVAEWAEEEPKVVYYQAVLVYENGHVQVSNRLFENVHALGVWSTSEIQYDKGLRHAFLLIDRPIEV